MSDERVVRAQFGAADTSSEPSKSASLNSGDGDGISNAMNDRLTKLEGAYDALKVVRPMTMTVVAILIAVTIGGFAFLGGQLIRLDGKVSSLDDKLSALPDKINAGLRDLTGTLATAITAARSGQPQVIILPAPAPDTRSTLPPPAGNEAKPQPKK